MLSNFLSFRRRSTKSFLGPNFVQKSRASFKKRRQSYFLDLAQFIERCDGNQESLSSFGASLAAFGGVDGIGKLGKSAEHIEAYAKALHYREMEFLYQTRKPSIDHPKRTKIAERLIQIFKKLGVQEAAEGVLEYAKNNNIAVSAQWYEKLNRWEEAKQKYRGNDVQARVINAFPNFKKSFFCN